MAQGSVRGASQRACRAACSRARSARGFGGPLGIFVSTPTIHDTDTLPGTSRISRYHDADDHEGLSRNFCTDASRDVRTDVSGDVHTDVSGDVHTDVSRDVRTDVSRDVRTDVSRDVRTDVSGAIVSCLTPIVIVDL